MNHVTSVGKKSAFATSSLSALKCAVRAAILAGLSGSKYSGSANSFETSRMKNRLSVSLTLKGRRSLLD
jgi:hypothetical protein